jgi:FKBP-type peptidyl-prolyl cis-trans isomerase
MDPTQLKKVVIPAVIVAGVILAVGGLFLLTQPGSGPPGTAQHGSGSAGTLTPVASADTADMTTTLPPVNAPEYKEVGDGLKIWDVKVGDGEECKPGAFVSMHYTGWRIDGFVFDSSLRKGQPLNMSLGQLIKGWQKGVPGMKVGGIRRLYIPSALGYGTKGAGADIPPDSDLVFEIKLLSTK